MMLRISQSGRVVVLALLAGLVAASGCAQKSWPLWKAYSASFIDSQGRVIDHQANDHSTSEGQSYAMFFALVANDRAGFDKVLKWTQDNLAYGDLGTHLPAWLWGRAPDGQWRTLDVGSASDSDCWIAYDLLEAGRLWKNDAYTQLGRKMLVQIAKQEVADLPGFGMMLMPGPDANFIHGPVYTLNPSYVPFVLFQRFASIYPPGPWSAIAANVPKMLKQSTRQGFAMDWVDYERDHGFWPVAGPTPPKEGESPKPGVGSYDAIRVYLWAGMVNGSGNLRARQVTAVPGMAAYLANHGAPPEKVSDLGVPMAQDGPVGFSAALLPYLAATPQMQKAAAQQKGRTAGELNPMTGLYGNSPTYYDQNLAMFGVGFTEGRFGFGPGGELTVGWTH